MSTAGTVHRRRAAALALTTAGAALVGGGVFSAWNVTSNVNSGTLSAATGAATLLDANGGVFNSGVSNLLPGDYFYRYIDVRNDGTVANSFTGTVDATGDLAGNVAVEATTCPVAWVANVCVGTTGNIGSGTPNATPVSITHGTIGVGALAAQHVRYKFTFSSSAPATLQGKNGTVTIGVSSTMVGGNDRTNS